MIQNIIIHSSSVDSQDVRISCEYTERLQYKYYSLGYSW